MATANVGSQGRITLPAQVCTSLGLKPGDKVDFVEIESGQFAIVAKTQSIKSLKGIVRKPQSAVSIEDMQIGVKK